jgi:hypothetical protein
MKTSTPIFAHLAYWAALIVLLVSLIGRDLSQPPTPPGYTKNQTSADRTSEAKNPKSEGNESIWDVTRKDPITYFTFWLVVFAGISAISTIGVWVVTGMSAKAARDSANALPIMERAYVFVGVDFIPHKRGPDESLIPLFRILNGRQDAPIDLTQHIVGFRAKLRVINYGKTPAFVKEISFSLKLIDDPSDIPDYKESFLDFEVAIPHNGEYPLEKEPVEEMIDVKEYKIVRSPVPYDITIEINRSQSDKIREGRLFVLVLAKVVYSDIMSERQESAICRLYDGCEGTFSYHGGEKYNYRT